MNFRYNGDEVVNMANQREMLKALVDKLTDEQVTALLIIVDSIAWEKVEATPEEIEMINKSREDIKAGRVVDAEDVWRELGI